MEVPIFGKGKFHIMKIDDEDYFKIKGKTLCITETKGGIYAKTHKMTNYVLEQKLVHRLVMSEPINMEVDHINHNTLDNRKENLRLVTHRQNMRNQLSRTKKAGRSSQYKGVCWVTGRKKWKAQCRMKNGKNKCIGHYLDEKEAAKAFDRFAAKEHGIEHEYLNFPEELK